MLVFHYSTAKLSLLCNTKCPLVGPGLSELEKAKTSKMQLFSKIANGFHSLTIFAKSSLTDVRLES